MNEKIFKDFLEKTWSIQKYTITLHSQFFSTPKFFKNSKTNTMKKATTQKTAKASAKAKVTKATKKAAVKATSNERGFAIVPDVTPITGKNVKSAAAREMSLRDFVLGALVANPDLDNEQVYELVQKAGRDNAQSTTEWYAARVRQGHIKAKK